jgi:adenine phosphoribosyltransferase
MNNLIDNLKAMIRDIPDFPQKGIIFRDITTLLKDKNGFKQIIDLMQKDLAEVSFDKIVGIESRGFIFGSVLAYLLGKGFIPVRKKGKLPAEVISEEYELEYGSDVLEIHADALKKGERVVIVDDLLATGGTAKATCKLVEKAGGEVAGVLFAIELEGLAGRDKLEKYPIFSYLKY